MLTLTKISLVNGVVYPVGTPESDIEGMTDGERQSLVSTGGLVVSGKALAAGPGNGDSELTDASELAAFGVAKKLVDIMAANDPPLRTKADVIAYLVNNKDLTPVNGIGKASSEIILVMLNLA